MAGNFYPPPPQYLCPPCLHVAVAQLSGCTPVPHGPPPSRSSQGRVGVTSVTSVVGVYLLDPGTLPDSFGAMEKAGCEYKGVMTPFSDLHSGKIRSTPKIFSGHTGVWVSGTVPLLVYSMLKYIYLLTTLFFSCVIFFDTMF